jgi:hypothetical protein
MTREYNMNRYPNHHRIITIGLNIVGIVVTMQVLIATTPVLA